MVWSLVALTVFALQFRDMQAVIKGLGDLVVTLGSYLAIRFLIPDRETVVRAVKVLAVVCVIQGVFMVSEQFTHGNFFHSFGANQPDSGRGTFALRDRWVFTLECSLAFRSHFSLAVDGKEIADGRLRGTCRSYGHGVHLARQHVVDGLGSAVPGLPSGLCVSRCGWFGGDWLLCWFCIWSCMGRSGPSLPSRFNRRLIQLSPLLLAG